MKRLLFVCIALIVSSSAVYALSVGFEVMRFVDVPLGVWYDVPVHELRLYNIVSGYEGNVFRPENNVKRSELAAMLSRMILFLQHPEGQDPWRRYEHELMRYEVYYPPDWEPVAIAEHAQGFRSPSMDKQTVQWAVLVLDDTGDIYSNRIRDMYNEYPQTTSVVEQEVKLNGRVGAYFVATSPEQPDWRREQFMLRFLGKIYLITNGGVENSDFDIFWRSLVILEPLPESADQNTEETDPDLGIFE